MPQQDNKTSGDSVGELCWVLHRSCQSCSVLGGTWLLQGGLHAACLAAGVSHLLPFLKHLTLLRRLWLYRVYWGRLLGQWVTCHKGEQCYKARFALAFLLQSDAFQSGDIPSLAEHKQGVLAWS